MKNEVLEIIKIKDLFNQCQRYKNEIEKSTWDFAFSSTDNQTERDIGVGK